MVSDLNLLCYLPKIYFAIFRKFTLLSPRNSLCYLPQSTLLLLLNLLWHSIVDPESEGSVVLLIKRRNSFGMAHCPSNMTYLARQGIKLVGARHCIDAFDCKLALADYVHELDAIEHAVSGTERFEVGIWPVTRLMARWSCSTMLLP